LNNTIMAVPEHWSKTFTDNHLKHMHYFQLCTFLLVFLFRTNTSHTHFSLRHKSSLWGGIVLITAGKQRFVSDCDTEKRAEVLDWCVYFQWLYYEGSLAEQLKSQCLEKFKGNHTHNVFSKNPLSQLEVILFLFFSGVMVGRISLE